MTSLHCSVCPDGVPYIQCSRCHTAVYCSKVCQSKHWQAGHRLECPSLISGRSDSNGSNGDVKRQKQKHEPQSSLSATSAAAAASSSSSGTPLPREQCLRPLEIFTPAPKVIECSKPEEYFAVKKFISHGVYGAVFGVQLPNLQLFPQELQLSSTTPYVLKVQPVLMPQDPKYRLQQAEVAINEGIRRGEVNPFNVMRMYIWTRWRITDIERFLGIDWMALMRQRGVFRAEAPAQRRPVTQEVWLILLEYIQDGTLRSHLVKPANLLKYVDRVPNPTNEAIYVRKVSVYFGAVMAQFIAGMHAINSVFAYLEHSDMHASNVLCQKAPSWLRWIEYRFKTFCLVAPLQQTFDCILKVGDFGLSSGDYRALDGTMKVISGREPTAYTDITKLIDEMYIVITSGVNNRAEELLLKDGTWYVKYEDLHWYYQDKARGLPQRLHKPNFFIEVINEYRGHVLSELICDRGDAARTALLDRLNKLMEYDEDEKLTDRNGWLIDFSEQRQTPIPQIRDMLG